MVRHRLSAAAYFYLDERIAAGYERLCIICGTYLPVVSWTHWPAACAPATACPWCESIGSCLLRLVIAIIFQLNCTLFMLRHQLPHQLVLTASVHLICLLVVRRKLQKKGQNLQAA